VCIVELRRDRLINVSMPTTLPDNVARSMHRDGLTKSKAGPKPVT